MPPAAHRRFFLTPPTHFAIKYVINAWMDKNNPVDQEKAQTQWQGLVDTYRQLGVQMEIIEPANGWPDSVFVGDSIFLYKHQAFASRFRYPERSGEVEHLVEVFGGRGYQVHSMPEGKFFEGNGETMAWNDMILAGYGVRSDRESLDFLAETLGVKVVPIRVLSPHFHADTCVCPLDEHTLAYVPAGMDEESQERIRALGVDLIEISNEEALLLACNSMAVGKQVILSTTQAPNFEADLRKAGFEPLALDLSEFAKSGGGAKCLTLEAYKYEE